MKDKRYVLNTALAAVLGLCLAVCMLLRTWIPAIVLPTLNIPTMAAVSLIALVVDHYLGKDARRCYLCVVILSILTFGILPYAAGFMPLAAIWKPALIGGAVFTALTFLFTSIQDRLATGPAAKAAPILSAFGLFLACQCFAGMII
jgi:hypothetical protein